MSDADDKIKIETELDPGGFTKGVRKLQKIAGEMGARIVDATASVAIGAKKAIGSIGSAIANIFKKVTLGALLVFALSVQKIFAALRESIGEVLKLRGGDTEKRVEAIKNKFEELKAAVAAAFLPLVEAALPFIEKAIDMLTDLFNKAAMITAAFMGQKEALQIIKGSAQKIADANKKTEKAAKGQLAAFDQINVLQQDTKAQDTGDLPKVAAQMVPITNDVLDKVNNIKDEIQKIWDDPVGALKAFVFWDNWKKFFAGLVDWMKLKWEEFKQFIFLDNWIKFFAGLWDALKATAADVWDRISVGAAQAWLVIQTAWGQIAPFFQNMWDTVVQITQDRWTAIKEMFEAAKQVFRGIIEFIHGIFTQDWAEAWRGITDIFQGTFNGWKAFLKGTINTMIDFINGLLRAIVLGINAMSNALNSIQFDIPDWIPVIGGNTFSLGIPQVTAPQIPRLATGAVIPPNAQFAAILGDQTHGTNIEAPSDLIRQIMREEMGKIQADIKIDFTGSMAALVREMKPHVDRENVRIGGSLIKSGVTI